MYAYSYNLHSLTLNKAKWQLSSASPTGPGRPLFSSCYRREPEARSLTIPFFSSPSTKAKALGHSTQPRGITPRACLPCASSAQTFADPTNTLQLFPTSSQLDARKRYRKLTESGVQLCTTPTLGCAVRLSAGGVRGRHCPQLLCRYPSSSLTGRLEYVPLPLQPYMVLVVVRM